MCRADGIRGLQCNPLYFNGLGADGWLAVGDRLGGVRLG